jgi:Pentapeptide repeats (9 copies)
MIIKWIFLIGTIQLFCIKMTEAQDSVKMDANITDTLNYEGRVIQQVLRKVHQEPEPKYFISVKVQQPASFKSASFQQMVFLDSVEFDKVTSFSNATFNDGAEAVNATFNDYSDFTLTTFMKDVDFTGARFKQQSDFSGSNFLSSGDFSNVIFSRKTNFNNLQLSPNTQLIFAGTSLPDTIDFSFNTLKLKNEIDLTVANFTDSSKGMAKTHFILFYKTDISQFHLDYMHFRLLVPDSVKSPEDTSHIRVSDDDKEAMFEGLLNNFNMHGQKESYRKLDIEYHRFKFYRKWWTIPFYWVDLVWWNFGYNKELVFLWTIFFGFLFTTINYSRLGHLNTNVYSVDKIPDDYSQISGPRRYWYSFVYTAVIFFKVTMNTDKLKFNHIGGTIYILLIYTSGLLCLAYMANFIIQK